jgi:hypothetical protein
MPAKIAEPNEGACVWASGSHVWKGNNGIFIKKEMMNKKKRIFSKYLGKEIFEISKISNEKKPFRFLK